MCKESYATDVFPADLIISESDGARFAFRAQPRRLQRAKLVELFEAVDK